MHALRSLERQARMQARLTLAAGAIIVALFAFAIEADAKCTIRAADPLIVQRYQGCSSKALISSLYNDLVTPYSFTCAKQISAECKKQGCENPQTREEVVRCLGDYVAVLESCRKQVDDAALMARCKDAKTWSVETIAARYPSAGGTLVAAVPTMTAPTVATPTGPVVAMTAAAPTNPAAGMGPVAPMTPMTATHPSGPTTAMTATAPTTSVTPAPTNPAMMTSAPNLATVAPTASLNRAPASAPNPPSAETPVSMKNMAQTNPNAPNGVPEVAIIQLRPPTSLSSTVKMTPPANPAPMYGPPSPTTPSRSIASPDSPRAPVTSGTLPGAAYRIVRKSARSSQSSRRIR